MVVMNFLDVNSQSLSTDLNPYKLYNYKNENYYVTELNLTNLSSDTLIVWFVDSLKKNEDTQNIYDYFFMSRGDMTLSNIIYDGNVSQIRIEIGQTFIKELLPYASFTIFFMASNPINSDYYVQFAKNNIVSVKESLLRAWNFTSSITWQQLLYENDNIILFR